MTRATPFFKFEADFVESWRCIPMQVRLKLDTCGIKLKLPQWHSFSAQERQTLVDSPCSTEAEIQHYRDLKQLVQNRIHEAATELAVAPNSAWKTKAIRSFLPHRLPCLVESCRTLVLCKSLMAHASNRLE